MPWVPVSVHSRQEGIIQNNQSTFVIPNKGGSIFKKLLQGKYDGNITFFHDTTKKVYGCMNMKFSIKTDA